MLEAKAGQAHPTAPAGARHRFSLVWVVPLAAAMVAGWLGWRALAGRGPLVEITFADASGLESGATKVKHRDVEIGVVEAVSPGPNPDSVAVSVRLRRGAESYMKQGTQYWAVRPHVGVDGISGLETLMSGVYLEADAGSGAPARDFVGLDRPPVPRGGVRGSRFTLVANGLGSLSIGSPVQYRGLAVGVVTGYDLAEAGHQISIGVFVRAPYDRLIGAGARFWNTSGVQAKFGADGLSVSAGSLQSVLAGGVAFDVGPGGVAAPRASPGGSVGGPAVGPFPLYADADAAKASTEGPAASYRLCFDDPVSGLDAGAPVTLGGVRVGSVAGVRLAVDPARPMPRAEVLVEIRSGPMLAGAVAAGSKAEALDAALARMVATGLRARLSPPNLLTGAQSVRLEAVPDAAPAAMAAREGDGAVELPTAPTAGLDDLIASADKLVRSVASVPLAPAVEDLRAAAAGLRALATSPEIKRSLRALDASLTNVERLTRNASGSSQALLDEAQRVLRAADRGLAAAGGLIAGPAGGGGPAAAALAQVDGAARSVRVLADYLEQHPEALLRGKPGGGSR